MIPNPDYKGVWKAPKIDNPDYKGVWAPRRIPVRYGVLYSKVLGQFLFMMQYCGTSTSFIYYACFVPGVFFFCV